MRPPLPTGACLALVLAGLLTAGAARAAELTLVRDGKPAATFLSRESLLSRPRGARAQKPGDPAPAP